MPAEAIPFKQSSHITSVAYDEETSTLVVSFSKASYSYAGVPAQVANGFSDAQSAGQYLETAIKGKYPFQKL